MTVEQRKTIIDGVLTAGKRLREIFLEQHDFEMSKLTTFDYGIFADKEAESIILKVVEKSKLPCRIIAEESGIIEKRDAEYEVFIDPLDGTVNFSRGIPCFCVGVAIFRKHEPVLGIVFDPMMDELFVGEVGNGVQINGKDVRPKFFNYNLYIHLGWFGADAFVKTQSKLKQAGIKVRAAGSGVLAVTYGAVGRGDGSVSLEYNPWDLAPGLVIATELGMRIEQLDGTPVNMHQQKISMISTPPQIFDKVKDAIT